MDRKMGKMLKATAKTKDDAPKTRPIRLDLDPRVHRMLRVEAAKADTSMVAFAQATLARELDRLQRLQ